MIDVVAIVGPTASGKTALSLELAKRLDGEIINGDSMQIYRDMSIGTAKIKPEEMAGIPHHLLDIKDPDEAFSVAEYQRVVRGKIEEIKSRKKLPIIVGGTGLYVQAVLFDYRFTEAQVDENLRKSLYEELENFGPVHMHAKLLALDPEADIHPNNTRRVVRAIEILLSDEEKTDRSLALSPMYNEVIIGLDMPRDVLYDRINKRVDNMVGEGLLAEVKSLYERGIRDVQSIHAIGYKELYAYLDGKLEFAEAIEQLKQNSRKYAKRQFTYFKNKLPIFWIDAMADPEKNFQEILAFMQEKERKRRIQKVDVQNKEQGI
ncbi:tRNA (adenosine(37)-N6)-dimethylallyltransferase MiaA [Planomicrobium sp. CPCC 101079]|uniref:tRNA (adenosine(37)-N6)-dimethylallyltransferase MiaA n=1 Tax=Planomicrobium sp. CPCC 101079 TaxID=2599618 RepID=UPI0011B4C6BC|nr:tRNA (adenosine(37)-N6)-dimethylallyltransferase MiaA [Planomicrobium sp. CPCC 101079]TWT04530.1 tRNA (adenosine(37)-N6)-dimethylallyltransferase MiaA [Planomicrobium sp. CPCC 101079]